MAADESDPSCPECGEAIGSRATYCMHCGAEFSSPDTGTGGASTDASGDGVGASVDDVASGISDAIGSVDGSDESVDEPDSDAPTVDHESPSVETADAETAGTSDGTGSEDRGWFHPDSLLDNSLTVVVGIVAGLFIGLFSLVVLALVPAEIGILVVLVAWLGSTAFLARRRTVFDAVQYGAYAFAALLLLYPVGLAVQSDGTIVDRLGAFAASLVGVGFIALIIAGIGYLAGLKGVE